MRRRRSTRVRGEPESELSGWRDQPGRSHENGGVADSPSDATLAHYRSTSSKVENCLPNGGARIGALVRNTDLAEDLQLITSRYTRF